MQRAASFAARDTSKYFASIDEKATLDCFFDLQAIATPGCVQTQPL